MKKNIVVNVNLHGGWLVFFTSPRKIIEKVMKNYNSQGYNFVFLLPPNPNPLFFIIQVICGIFTLGFYVPLPAHMFVFEKDVDEEVDREFNPNERISLNEPQININLKKE